MGGVIIPLEVNLMQDSLHPKAIDLIDIQKEILKEILDAKFQSGEIKSNLEYQAEWNQMVSKIEGDGTFTTLALQEETTDAHLFNQTFEGIEADIRSVFTQINRVDETITKHQWLNQSLLHNLKLRIKILHDELTKQEQMLDIQGAEELHFETFINANGMETDHTYYTERNGQEAPLDYKVKWDGNRESINLPVLISDNGLTGAGGIRLGKIAIRKQLGVPFSEVKNPFHDLSHAVDSDLETFWSEQIMMDTPIEVDMGEEYYGINFGALVELEIQFDYLTPMNEMGFAAFGEYPFDMVGVKYFESDDEDEVAKDLIHPKAIIQDMKSRTIDGNTSFQFPDISAKRVRIIFNQPHYIKSDFIASTKAERNVNLWLSSKTKEGVKRIEINEFEIDKIIEAFTQDDYHSMSKYEYQYGLYNLSIRRNEYQPTGIYVSQMIPLHKTIKTVQLEAKETHPGHLQPLRFTDVEYYVHDGIKWYPILPFSTSKIQSELLFPSLIQGKHQAELRFKAEGEVIFRKNGILTTGQVALLPDKKTVLFGEYDPSSYYTAEYTPTSKAWTIDFLEEYKDENGIVQPNTLTEEFRGSDSKGRIQLQRYPFADKAKLNKQNGTYNPSYLENDYVPIRVRFIDSNGYHIEQPMNAKDVDLHINNVTNYFESKESPLEAFNDSTVFYQYRIVGNEVQFNTVIPESTRVIIEYPYLVSHVRIKAILRRNLPGFHGLSPVVEQYVAHFQTLV